MTLNSQKFRPAKFLRYTVSHFQKIFLYMEGNNSLVNDLFHFHSKHQDLGVPFVAVTWSENGIGH